MAAIEPTVYEKRDELRKVLQSRHFAKARKKARFLEFVSEQSFQGHADKLNEYLIGIEVYERGSDFDPQQDAIVRVQAHEIRRALKEYYDEEGKDDGLRIDFPAGHYVPVFSRVESPPLPPVTEIPSPVAPPASRISWHTALTAVLAIACFVMGLVLLLQGPKPPPATAAGVKPLPESVRWFWKAFLPPAEPPLIVIPVHPLLRVAHDGDSTATHASGHLIPKNELPEFRGSVHFREFEKFNFVAATTDFTAVGEALGLLNLFELFSGASQGVRLKPGRLVDYEEVKRANTILLGGNQAWSHRIFTYPEGFRFYRSVIENKSPRPGERPVYKPGFDPVTNELRRDYALVLMLPNERKAERILLIYGIYTQGSQAAIEYLTNPDRLQELQNALAREAGSPPEFFQVLLETTVENYVPGKTTLVSTRIIPGP